MGVPSRDVRTLGVVLRRTNYGEADRILNIITPKGKIAAIAKGVRRARSKLAGGVEMFTLTDLNVHFGKGGLGTVTGAQMVRHYGEIVKDLGRLELAGVILRWVDVVAEGADNADFFEIVGQSLVALNDGGGLSIVEAWVRLNLGRAIGEEINLYRDVEGERLKAGEKYEWDMMEEAFRINSQGEYGTDEIKMLRLMLTAQLSVVQRIKCDPRVIERALWVARTVTKMK